MSATFPLYPTVHPVRVVEKPEKPSGWTVYEYRGAQIRSSGVHNRLVMKGHPYDGSGMFGNPELCLKLIDCWLDRQGVPAPMVWPVKKG